MKDAHDMTAAVGDAADTPMPMMDRRLKEQLLILMLLDCLRCDDDTKGSEAAETEEEGISLNDMQVDVSKQIMTIAQRMCDNHMPDLCHRDEDDAKPSSSDHLVPSEQQLVDDKEAAEGDATTVVVTKSRASVKKRRYRMNKAAAKRRKKTSRISWLRGAGILPQIIMMALGSITTLIVTFAIIHQRVDGSSEKGAAPALPPTASKSLLRRITQTSRIQHQPDSAVTSTTTSEPPVVINSPSLSDVPPPFLLRPDDARAVSQISPLIISSRRTQQRQACFDTPKWKDSLGGRCWWYEEFDDPGCPHYSDLYTGDMGPASENCCYCGGGSITPPPTINPYPSASPTLSSSPTEFCLDTPNWKDPWGYGCDYYEKRYPACSRTSFGGTQFVGDMGPATEHCCYCGGGSATLPPTITPYPSASPTLSSSPTEFCLDTPDWKDPWGFECSWFEEFDDRGCPKYGDSYTGVRGSARENCCYCGGGARTCEDYRSMCRNLLKVRGFMTKSLRELCEEAESCHLCDGTDQVFESYDIWLQQDPSIDKCKCDYWLRLCEDIGQVVACNSARNKCCMKNILCPIVIRSVLSSIYVSAKGAEWTVDTNWNDVTTHHCNWHGVICNDYENNKYVRELKLRNNGLSGRLSPSIGSLTTLTKLDLSDNDIKGSIPTEIGLLTQLKYLRLSYNAFTGTAPEELADLIYLKLLQLQSNRITNVPKNIRIKWYGYENEKSKFVADCGVPSAFENALNCEGCTMCCNANEDCYPQEKSQIQDWRLNYSSFAAILFAFFTLLCCMIVFFLSLFRCCLSRFREQQGSASTLTISMQEEIERDDDYALSKIGKDSVYSYFVTDLRFGWLCAFLTLAAQAGILIFFVQASEANLQDDKTDIEFTWKCPRDTDSCDDKSDLENVGWIVFSVLMAAFLAKDLINGSKLINHSSKSRHTFWARIRYFIGGLSLCIITLFALYVSIVYNSAIATSNTDIILNSVVVLFIMDMDEVIFAAIEAWNEKWTAHVAESKEKDYDILKKEIELLQKEVQEIQNLHKAEIGTKRVQSYSASPSETIHDCTSAAEGTAERDNVSAAPQDDTNVLLNANTIATHQDFVDSVHGTEESQVARTSSSDVSMTPSE